MSSEGGIANRLLLVAHRLDQNAGGRFSHHSRIGQTPRTEGLADIAAADRDRLPTLLAAFVHQTDVLEVADRYLDLAGLRGLLRARGVDRWRPTP